MQCPDFLRVHSGVTGYLPVIPGHQRERFIDTAFTPPQFRHGLVVGCIAGEVKTAESFDGDNFSIS